MSKTAEIRCYDYVNHPYERVRNALCQDAIRVFQGATKAAASRAQNVAAELHVNVGGIGVQTDIHITIKKAEESAASGTPKTALTLEWEAATLPKLFPLMKANLAIYPLTNTETQLEFSGVYEPPFGALGKALNVVAGHKIAEVSVHRFMTDVADYLRRSLS